MPTLKEKLSGVLFKFDPFEYTTTECIIRSKDGTERRISYKQFIAESRQKGISDDKILANLTAMFPNKFLGVKQSDGTLCIFTNEEYIEYLRQSCNTHEQLMEEVEKAFPKHEFVAKKQPDGTMRIFTEEEYTLYLRKYGTEEQIDEWLRAE